MNRNEKREEGNPVKIILKRPSLEYAKQILDYQAEFTRNEEFMHGSGYLEMSTSIEEFITNSIQGEKEVKVDRSYFVEATQFLIIEQETNELVGMIQIRHRLNQTIAVIGGHIGYSIRKSKRKQGYAKAALRLALKYCKEELHLLHILITCEQPNIASRKTIISQGGVKEDEVLFGEKMIERYWIDLSCVFNLHMKGKNINIG